MKRPWVHMSSPSRSPLPPPSLHPFLCSIISGRKSGSSQTVCSSVISFSGPESEEDGCGNAGMACQQCLGCAVRRMSWMRCRTAVGLGPFHPDGQQPVGWIHSADARKSEPISLMFVVHHSRGRDIKKISLWYFLCVCMQFPHSTPLLSPDVYDSSRSGPCLPLLSLTTCLILILHCNVPRSLPLKTFVPVDLSACCLSPWLLHGQLLRDAFPDQYL